MIKIFINNIPTQVLPDTTVLQACEGKKIIIPKFCFHSNLQIAGNCRMCLVEVKNSLKPVASCALPVIDNMHIFTDSPLVKKARESVLEFLLINHPLDCPICDQGSECDLQDQSLIYGSDKSRFFFPKRVVEDKNCGPFIKTIMTRCIHCTRCVRFSQDITNLDNLGTVGRGKNTEISFYLKKTFESKFSGNVIDLCPVGALTSKPFAYKVRSWELNSTNSIDLSDGLGTPIKLESTGNKIIRVSPMLQKHNGNEWISNKTRFIYDSFTVQRISRPLIKTKNQLQKSNWEDIFLLLNFKLSNIDSSLIKIQFGDLIDLKLVNTFKNLIKTFGIKNFNYFSTKNQFKLKNTLPNQFLAQNLNEMLSTSDGCLLFDFNPDIESLLLNINIQKLKNTNNLQIFSIGPKFSNTYDIKNIGLSLKTINEICNGKHPFCKKIKNFQKLTIICGSNLYNHPNVNLIIRKIKYYISPNIVFVQSDNGFSNFLEIHPTSLIKQTKNKLIFLYNTNDTLRQSLTNKKHFIIYFGHHFTPDASKANIIIPITFFYEKCGINLSTFGKCVKTKAIIKPLLDIRTDETLVKNFLFFKYVKNATFNEHQSYIQLLIKYPYLAKNFLCWIKHPYKRYNTKLIKFFTASFLNHKLVTFWQKNILDQNSKNLFFGLKSSNKFQNFK